MDHLEKSIETALQKMSKAHDLIGRLEAHVDGKNPNCRVKSPLVQARQSVHLCMYGNVPEIRQCGLAKYVNNIYIYICI